MDPPRALERVGRSFGRSEMGGKVLRGVHDVSVDPLVGLGRIGGPSRRSRMGRGILPKVRDK